MNWELYIEKLRGGETIQIRPRGNSMQPKINSGELVTIAPVDAGNPQIEKGDIVFCKVKGSYYVHLVQAVKTKMGGYLYQIGNNKKHTNGTISVEHVFGKVIKVEK